MVDRIRLLADELDHAAAVANLRCAEWGDPSEPSSLASWLEITHREAGRDTLPITLVAVSHEGEVVGAIGLADHDVPERTDSGPWLVGLVVRRDRRRTGVGTNLAQAVLSLARERGDRHVWVATTRVAAAQFYTACGWHEVEQLSTANETEPVVILATTV